MIEGMVYRNPFFWVETKALSQEVQACATDLYVVWNLSYPIVNVLDKFCLIFACEGRLSENCLKKSHSEGPHVNLMIVELIIENFWSHVQGGTTVKLYHLVLSELSSKTEVA